MALLFEQIVGEDLNLGTGTTTVTNPGGGTLPGTQISLSTLGIAGANGQALVFSAFSSAIIAAGQSTLLTASYPGALLGDIVLSSSIANLSGLILSSYISSSGSVTFLLANPTTQSVAWPGGGTNGIKALALRLK